MRCFRCNGLMIYEKFYAVPGIILESFVGWRCVACGDIVDEVILRHRGEKDGSVGKGENLWERR